MSTRLNESQTKTARTASAVAKSSFAWGAICAVMLAIFVALASVTTFGIEGTTEAASSWSATVGSTENEGTSATIKLDVTSTTTNADGTTTSALTPNSSGVYGTQPTVTITVTSSSALDSNSFVVKDSSGLIDSSDTSSSSSTTSITWTQTKPDTSTSGTSTTSTDTIYEYTCSFTLDDCVKNSIYVAVYSTSTSTDTTTSETTTTTLVGAAVFGSSNAFTSASSDTSIVTATTDGTSNGTACGTFTVDTTAPVVSISMSKTASTTSSSSSSGSTSSDNTEYEYYSYTVTATITVSDATFDTTNSKVMNDKTQLTLDSTTDSEGNTIYWTEKTDEDGNGTGTYTATLTLTYNSTATSNSYTLTVVAYDQGAYAYDGNATTETGYTYVYGTTVDGTTTATTIVLKADSQPPVVSVTSMNPYYGIGSECKVEITVKEENFDASKVTVKDGEGTVTLDQATDSEGNKLTDSSGNAVYWTSSTDSDGNTVWTATVTYTTTSGSSDEGSHEVTVAAEDLAGNKYSYTDSSNNTVYYASSGAFVIDTTPPEVSIKFDNNDVANGKYYDAKRTATITVTDANLASSGISDYVTVSGISGDSISWSSSTDSSTGKTTWTGKYTFSDDGTYSFTVAAEDLAGNKYSYTDSSNNTVYYASSGAFVIDTTAPTIALTLDQVKQATLDGVDYFDAAVGLTVTATDTNLSSGTYKASGTATNEGSLTVSGTSGTVTITYGENTSKSANGIQVTATDLAGNSTTYTYGGTASTSVNDTTATSSSAGSTADKAGTVLSASGFYVDLTAPSIAGGSSGDIANNDYVNVYGSDSSAYVFYNSATSLVVVITDALGLDAVSVDGGDATVYTVEDSVSDGATSKTITVSLKDGYEWDRDVVLTAVDVAGNTTTWSISPTGTATTSSGTSSQANTTLYEALSTLYPLALIKDTVAPVLNFSGVSAGAYYNSTQSLTLSVSELNFHYLKSYDSSQVVLTITKVAGNSSGTTTTSTVSVKSFTGTASTGEYSYTKTFSADGHYTVVAQVTDPATNTTTITQKEFTIDTTSPTISVSWDNDDVSNDKYYSATRTATITIVEHNFDSSLISIDTNGTVGSWSTNGDTHTITVSFTTDGTYNLSISGADEAGNSLETYTADEFVVDLTAPSITFGSEVEDSHAYNGAVTPTIYFEDEANFDASGTSWTLVGTKNGDVTALYAGKISTSTDDTGQTVVFVDFDQDDPDVDDIYTLTATMTDLAGNSYEASITFSVNRYGSTYRVVDASQYEENNGYLLEAPVVVVEEINVSGVAAEDNDVSVTLVADTSHLTLVDDVEYDEVDEVTFSDSDSGYLRVHSTSGESDSNGWSVYTYTIGSGNFATDGQYSVVLSSDDVSGNTNTSTSYYDRDDAAVANAQVTFILDETDPVVQITNVSEGEYYDSDAYEVTFKVIEEVGLATDGVTVVLDGEEVEVTSEGSGSYSFTVSKASFTSRSISITATDLAGRTGTGQISDFHVTTNILELHLPWVIAACVAVLAVIFFIIWYKRKKDEDEDEDETTAAA